MKEVIGILVNDVHLDKDNGPLIKSIFDQLIHLCKAYKTNRIFCGGDVFTNRSGQPLSCLTDWKDVLGEISKAKLELHVIPGNHDKTDSEDERSYLDVFSEPCVRLYRRGERRIMGGVLMGFIPYFPDDKWLEEYKRVMDMVENNLQEGDIEEDTPMVLITHSGFDGVRNNDGSKVSSAIKPSMFEEWNKVLIGHYHNASNLSSNVIYTGSAYQNNYGETIDDKGFTVIFSDATIKFEPSCFPKYIKKVIPADDKEKLRKLTKKYGNDTENFVRFVFKGKKTDCQNINITELSELGIDCKFEVDETVEAMEASESETVLSYDRGAIIKDFMKFCNENGIRGDKLKYGLDLIKQCGIQSK